MNLRRSDGTRQIICPEVVSKTLGNVSFNRTEGRQFILTQSQHGSLIGLAGLDQATVKQALVTISGYCYWDRGRLNITSAAELEYSTRTSTAVPNRPDKDVVTTPTLLRQLSERKLAEWRVQNSLTAAGALDVLFGDNRTQLNLFPFRCMAGTQHQLQATFHPFNHSEITLEWLLEAAS